VPFYAGLDVAQADDFTALVVVQTEQERARCILVERFRHLPYPQAVDRIVASIAPFPDVLLLADATGVGRAVLDILRLKAPWIRLVAVTLHGGNRIKRDASGLHIPKRTLMAPLAALLGSGRLEIPAGPLADELRHFGRKVDARTGHERLEARRGHDDLTVALALAALPIARGRRAGPREESELRPLAQRRSPLRAI
jgi:hypothetical protein